MIKLVVDGVCKGCVFQSIVVSDYDKSRPIVRCKHAGVCKYVDDPNGAEKLRATVEELKKEYPPLMHEEWRDE